MLGSIGPTEIIIGVLILIIFFGSKKMNELARNAGEASKELKKVKKEYTEAASTVNEEPKEEVKVEKISETKPETKGEGV